MALSVRKMFDEIARRYDFLNHTLSLCQDVFWRRACVKELKKFSPGKRLLDLCGGTGDFAATYEKFLGKPELGVLGDFSLGMLAHSKGKRTSAVPVQLDAMKMPFPDATFDVVLNGFGMRNLPNAEAGLVETARVLRPGGYFMVLEFFAPRNPFNRFFYGVLAPMFIPLVGAFFSGKREAYEYLVKSIRRFLPVKDFALLAEKAGFEVVSVRACDFGIAYRVLLKKRGAA